MRKNIRFFVANLWPLVSTKRSFRYPVFSTYTVQYFSSLLQMIIATATVFNGIGTRTMFTE
jgi:hypothetical protein